MASRRPLFRPPGAEPSGSAPNQEHTDRYIARPLPPLPLASSALPALPASPTTHDKSPERLSLPTTYEIPALRRKPENEPSSSLLKYTQSTTLPLFSSKSIDKKKASQGVVNNEPSDGAHAPKRGVKRNAKGPTTSGKQAVPNADHYLTGQCMTCDSTVRWPHGVATFRCMTCHTINDLEVVDRSDTTSAEQSQSSLRNTTPVSVARTNQIIDNCLRIYLTQQLKKQAEMERVDRPNHSNVADDDDRSRTLSMHPLRLTPLSTPLEPKASTRSARAPLQSMHQPRSGGRLSVTELMPIAESAGQHAHQQLSSQNDQGTGHMQDHTTIFAPLEKYIADCCTGCSSFNASFFNKAPPHGAQLPESRRVSQVSTSRNSMQVAPVSVISDMDAKTLLLGDIAENGGWWTGAPTPSSEKPAGLRRTRSPERGRDSVSGKTPRIDWVELAEWYRTVLHAGENWQQHWNALRPTRPGKEHRLWTKVPLQWLQHDIIKARVRLQRSLLKSMENMLRRPRQCLKTAEDCRWLLMALANPLLVPSSARSIMQSSQLLTEPSRRHQHSPADQGSPGSTASRTALMPHGTNGLGHHSGIIKRIVGLMSNLPNDVHVHLVSWMSRFSDNHFQRLVDMLSSFVTHRLSRQTERPATEFINPTEGLVPSFNDAGVRHASQLHAALDSRPSAAKSKADRKPKLGPYADDWQVKAAARVMALLFQANVGHTSRKRNNVISDDLRMQSAGLNAKYIANSHGQIVPINNFYNSMLDQADLIGDFVTWETTKTKFTFCQYPFFLSIWAKIRIMEHDARRQMEVQAREAFFDSIMTRKAVSQYLVLKVRRDCLVEDSLKGVSAVVGSGSNDIKKELRIDFVGEEGVDAGGLRKEWFLSLVREIFDPNHGLFLYDEDSRYCYFNPNCFESSEQFFMVGILLGLAIYNSTMLDVPFPPFVFKKVLASAPSTADKLMTTPRLVQNYTLEDLAEYKPSLAKGLRQLLDFEGDVQTTFCRDFVVEVEQYGKVFEVPLCAGGAGRPVTNANRREFVDLYIRYLLDTSVTRQYEPFKRGFFTVCGGNALSLFQPEEIELLIRGSDEPLDVGSLKVVAAYDNWPLTDGPPEQQQPVRWFWETFEQATPANQRKLLSFITGSDRIPAMGATSLVIRLQYIRDAELERSGTETSRFPIARTCFNTLSLHPYRSKDTLLSKLWMAVEESEGFGLK